MTEANFLMSALRILSEERTALGIRGREVGESF
jgi:hypothetical protein